MSSAVNQPIQRLRRHSIASLSVGSNSLVMVPEQTEMQAQAFQNRRPSTPTSPALALRRQQKQQQQHQQQQIYHNGVGAASAAADNNNNEMFNSNGMSVGSLYSSRNGEEEKTDEADLTHIPQTYATGFIPETSATASPPGSSHDSSSSSNDYNMVRSNSSSSSSTSPISSVPTAKQFILFHDPASAKSIKVLDYLRRNIPAGCQLAVDIGASINERQLKLIAHCVDTQELKEWCAMGYLTHAEMKSVVEGSGRIEPIIRVLREDFTTIYPRPALFSPLNGCMTGAVNVEKVKAMLNTSVDWLDPVYANLVNATTSNNSGSYFSNSGSGKSASSSTGPLIKRSPSSGGGWGFNRRSRASSDESNNRPEIQAQPQIPSRPVSVATPSVSENSARRRSRTIFGGDHQPNSKTVGSLKPGSNSSVVSAPVSPSVKVFGPSSASDLPSGHSISQSIAANSTASSLASDASSNAPPSSNLYQFAAAAAVTAGAGNGGAVMISSSSSSSSSSALASGVITSPITPTKKSYILYHTESNPNSIDVHAYLQLYLPQTYDLIVREQPTEKELRMLSHCIDEQELNEWAAMGYISRNDMKGALHHGKMDPIINMLKQDFSIIYPYPALFSPFNGTMTGAISLEKVRALLSTSLDGADPSYADSKRRNTDAGIISTSSSVSSVKESGVGAGGGVKKSKSSSSSSAKSLVASSHQIPQALITSSNILKNSKSQVALPSCDEITGVFWISPPSITDNHSSPAPISSKATPIISSDIASPFLLSPTQIRKTNNQQQNLQQQPTPPRKPALQTTYLRVDEDLKFRARAISGKKTLSSPDLFTPTPAEKSSATKVATTSPTIDSPIYVTTTVRTGPTRKTTSTKKSSSRHSFSEVQQPAKIRQFLLFHDPNSIVSVAILRHLQDNLSKVYTGYELVIEENFPTEKDLRLIAHCMDDRELRELNSFSYITKEELAQIREGKIELLVSVLMQNFFTIYPIPALFSPLSGCMSGSLSLEKVKALLTVSPEWADPNYAFIIVNNNAGEANSLKPKEKKKMGSFVALDSLSRDSLDDKAFLAARVDATPTDIDNMMSNSDVSASDIQKKNTPSGSSSSSPTKKQKHATPGTIKTKDLNNAHHQLQRRPDFKSPAVKYNELFLHLEFIYDINKSGNHKENKDVTTYVEKTISSLKMEAMRGNAAKARQFLFFHDPDSPVSRDVLTYVRQNLIEPNPLYDLVVQEAGPNQKQLKLIAHCMDDRELKELVSLSYLTRDEALQISRDGKVEIMVSLLEQHFSTIYPTPALFSPLNGCMSSSLNLDKVKAAINISPEWSDPNWAATGPPSTETRRISADTTPLFSPIPPSQQQQQRTIEKNSALNMSKSSVNSQYSVGSADVKYHQLQNFNNTSVFSLGNNNDISGGGVGKANSKTSIGSRTNSQESSKVSLPAAAAAQQQGQARQFLFFHDASNSMSVKVLKYLQEKLPKSDLAVEEMGPTDRDLKLIAHCIDDQELKEWVALGYLSRADMFQCANGRIDPIVKLLKEEFKVIFPRPALFSPLNGCMTGSLNLEKVVSMISSSSDWADPASALSSPAVRTARSSNSSSSLPVSPKK